MNCGHSTAFTVCSKNVNFGTGRGLGGGFLEMQGIQRTTDVKRRLVAFQTCVSLKSSRLTWPRDGVNIGLRLNPLEPPKVDFEASRKLRSPAPLPKF